MRHVSTGAADREDRRLLPCHRHQGPGVGCGAATQPDRFIVAAQFALDAHPMRHPPYRRVIEEQCLDGHLEDIDQIVVPADVCELVSEDGFELLDRQAHRRGRREKNHRTQPADRARPCGPVRCKEADVAVDTHPHHEPGR